MIDAVSRGLLLGYAADRLWGDPRRGHPVAGFGNASGWLELRTYAPRRTAGVLHVAAAVGVPFVLTLAAPRAGRTVLVAACTWAALGGRSLEVEARAVHTHLDAGDVPAARGRIRSLVGRDPSTLDAGGLARAVVESVAENSVDAVTATLWWGAALGAPGVVAHRSINTLDAMIGHRSPRYVEFGWAAARSDDLVGWVPSRLTVVVIAIHTAVRERDARAAGRVLHVVRRDAPRHPSPNAGPVEAAVAAALGVTLGGSNRYAGIAEDRGLLGDGPPPAPVDIARAVRLMRQVDLATLAAAVLSRVAVRAVCARRHRPR